MAEPLTLAVPGEKGPARQQAPGTGRKTAKSDRLNDSPERTQRLQKACEDMEALFVHQLIKEMRATVPKSGLFGKSQARDIYTGMLDSRLAQEIAQGRSLGLSALLMRQLNAGAKLTE